MDDAEEEEFDADAAFEHIEKSIVQLHTTDLRLTAFV